MAPSVDMSTMGFNKPFVKEIIDRKIVKKRGIANLKEVIRKK